MLLDRIKKRRAVYPTDYADKPISKEEILQLLEAANWAPTHRRTEPWRFKVFQDNSSKEKLANFLVEKYKENTAKPSPVKVRTTREKVFQAGAVIAICMQRDPTESVPEWEEIASVAMAVQNMWLLTHDLNLGAYWSSPASIHQFQELLPMLEGERCIGFFYLGKLKETPEEGRRETTAEEKTTWVTF